MENINQIFLFSNVQQEPIEVSIEERRHPGINIVEPMPKMNGGELRNGLLAINVKEQKQSSIGIDNGKKEKVKIWVVSICEGKIYH